MHKKNSTMFFLFFYLFFADIAASMHINSTGQPSYRFSLQKVQSLLHQEDISALSGFVYYAQAQHAYNQEHAKKNMSSLFFKQSAFTSEQTGLVPKSLFSHSTIAPHITYKEWGGLVTAWSKKYINNKIVLGVRVDVPVKKVTLKNKMSKNYYQLTRAARVIKQNVTTLLADPQAPESKGKAAYAKQRIGMSEIESYAYRLDFLSDLNYGFTLPQSNYPIVDYHDASFQPLLPITIYNQDVTNGDTNPVSVLNQLVGEVPAQPYALSYKETRELPLLPAEGQSSLGERARFSDQVDYTPLGIHSHNQERLWVIPTYIEDPAPKDLAALEACGIDLCSQSRSGIGTITTDFFSGYHFSNRFYAEYIVGITWPTGKKQNPLKVLQPVLGNNGHTEICAETQGLYDLTSWISVRGDLGYTWVLGHKETRAAQFLGATVTNIGPSVEADVSWNYGIAALDLIFNIQKIQSFFYCGYGFYGKQPTHISFCSFDYKKCSGEEKKLASSVLEKNSSARAHTFHTALFCELSYLELSCSAEYTFAGKNMPQLALGSFGLTFYF